MENNPLKEQAAELSAVIDQIQSYLRSDDADSDYTKWHALIDELIKLSSADLTPEAQEELQHELSELPNIAGRRTEYLHFALDKINTSWNNFVNTAPDGQLCFNFDTTLGNEKGKALVYFSLDFFSLGDNVHITKKLLPYDQRVYIAVDALYRAGNMFVTIQQIYRAMGYNGTAGKSDKEKIDKAMIKLKAAHVTIDNSIEVDKAKYKYPHVVVDTQLLNAVRCRIIDNGQIVDGAYKILDEPVLMSFARGRGQVTQIERQLLSSPLNATDQNILIEDYLIERIERAKNGKGKRIILLNTLYEYAGITQKKQKQRAPSKIIKLLDYYKSIDYIKSWQFPDDRIEIEL